MLGFSARDKEQSNQLINDICEKFQVRKGFAQLYAERLHPAFPGLQSLDEFYAKCSPMQKIWVEFALTTNQRGREICDFINQQALISKRNKRFIDIGCGYGGFVVAFAERGFDSYGIEIDRGLFELSQQNCLDYGIRDHVLHDDFLKMDLEKLGKFDIITCNDVIEHLQNPEEGLAGLAKILAKGGTLFLEIPNKDAISFVEADGHFGIFGIVLLDRQNAALYRKQMTNADDYEHMGEYYPLGFYKDRLSKAGLKVTVHNRRLFADIDEVPRYLAIIAQKFSEWHEKDRMKISYFIAENVVQGFLKYVEQLSRDYERALYHGEMESFKTRYLSTFWTLIATA